MHTVPDKMENIRTAGAYIEKVSAQKPDFVILPEMFCCPYQTENFPHSMAMVRRFTSCSLLYK